MENIVICVDINQSSIETLKNLNHETIFQKARVHFMHVFEVHKHKADIVVVATRGKHGIEGFFNSSLADFLCKYSSCDVLVARPKV